MDDPQALIEPDYTDCSEENTCTDTQIPVCPRPGSELNLSDSAQNCTAERTQTTVNKSILREVGNVSLISDFDNCILLDLFIIQ